MRACASGQTVDQQKLYGGYVSFYHELAVPEPGEAMLRYLRQTVAHACGRALQPFAGPVHLNAPFRDPLAPTVDGITENSAGVADWERFFLHLAPPAGAEPSGPVPPLATNVHGMIVAGPAQPGNPESYSTLVAEIARRLGWPVLADGLSPARGYSNRIPHLVTAYDAILRKPATAEQLAPEVVLCLGGWPTSKVLRQWLERSKAPQWLVTTRPDNRDALHGNTRQVAITLQALAAGLPEAGEANGYEQLWRSHERYARGIIDERLEAEAELFEPKAAWLLATNLPAETPVFIASSMPVRDVEYVWPPNERRLRPFFNRGANGIDGTLSTALGVAHGNKPAVLLTGDLALLHDTNGFLIGPKLRGSLTVVLINNKGGGIFEHLPVAQFEPPFEEFFATPQQADFAKLSESYGAEHVLVHDWAQFVELISALPEKGIRVLEICTDRKRDAAMRKQLFADAAG
jgi:2-succinyl-5-enolpyruvyl-6-hydroxy-3-cyclohexene-1-carboxylate synthase